MDSANRPILEGFAREVIRHKAWQLIGKYGFSASDREDLEQEMMLDLLRRLGKYDPQRAALTTFISRIVERKTANLIRHQRQLKRDFRRWVHPLDALVKGQDGEARGLDEVLSQDAVDQETGRHDRPASERLDLNVDLQRAIDGLPEELRHLVVQLQSQTVLEIAREMGIARSTVYRNGLARLRRIFEDRGLREYLPNVRHIEKRRGR